MPQPPEYQRLFSFTGYQEANPTDPLPGDKVDGELNRVKQTSDQVRANLALIQRDDGALGNATVGVEQIKPETRVGLSAVSDWSSGTPYQANDGVWYQNVLYRCVDAHTSTSFSTDLAAGKWSQIVDFDGYVGTTVAARDAAQTAANNAETSETNAASSASAASTSASNAATSETNAASSASAAATSETNAAASETAAQTAETNAETAETNAASSASAAATSETNAAASESAAATSETNAAASEAAAATSETNAAASESAAATSETNAAASEDKASLWAGEAEDVEVEPGEYSAFHWAKKSEESAGSVTSVNGQTGAVTTPTDADVAALRRAAFFYATAF